MCYIHHLAWRTTNKQALQNFYIKFLGYKMQQEFELEFKYPIGSLKVGEIFLGPIGINEKDYFYGPFTIVPNIESTLNGIKFIDNYGNIFEVLSNDIVDQGSAHSVALTKEGEPQIFISQGEPDSIVDRWIRARNTNAAIHHMAYHCDTIQDLEETIEKWKQQSIEFSSDIIICEETGLQQIFSRPIEVMGGMIIELLFSNDETGFCTKSVQQLMRSSQNLEKK